MSAVPALDQYLDTPAASSVTQPAVLPQPRVTPQPRAIPGSRTLPRKRAESSSVGDYLGGAVLFAFMVAVVFIGATLWGHVMVEKARREGLQAVERSRAATRDLAALRERVNSITSAKSIDQWARENGFCASDELAKTSGGKNLVALNQ